MTRSHSPNKGLTAFIAALATFTSLVWIGVVTRAVLLRKIHETPVAEAPAHPQSQPIRASRTDTGHSASAPAIHLSPGGVFPGDVPGEMRR
ncbi:MAG: hypothetical protein HY286_07205 [Planctomycetes bacterium]|nr:hypothetical protein [Planctomycetota bacterium]